MIENLSMVTRVVEDQDAVIGFYTEKLGLKKTGDHPGPHGRFVTVAPEGNNQTELILISPDGFSDEERDRLTEQIGQDWGLIYEVDDCRQTYEELRSRDVEFRTEPQEVDWGIQAVATDPDGNEIVLQERPYDQ